MPFAFTWMAATPDEEKKEKISVDDSDKGPEFSVQAFFAFFISSLVLHLGQALGLFTLVSHP